jgi:hypothetical protein
MKAKKVNIKINIDSTYEILEVILDFTNRTEPTLSRFCDDGEFYFVHEWRRIDGTVESYAQCLK